jgi:hypothetical protein
MRCQSRRGDAPPPPPVYHADVLFNVTLAWIGISGSLEPGVLLAIDATSWGSRTVTVNLALGFGAL